jgi:hypothetical protein
MPVNSYGLAEQFAISQRHGEISRGILENDHLSVLMGNPSTGTPGGAERDMWVTHHDYPAAFKQARDNTYWADVVTGLGLIDMGPFGTVICPTQYVNQIDFAWRERSYQTSILDYNPEETAARLLRQTTSEFRAKLVRRGIAAQMEVGYARTEAGARDWIYQTQAFADSVKLTIIADVVWSLFNAYRSAQMWEAQHGHIGYDMFRRLEQDAIWYGAANLTPTAFDQWDLEAKKYAASMGFVPDVYVAEPKGLAVVKRGTGAYFRVHREYLFVGPDGRAARLPAPANQWVVNGTPMYVTPVFTSYDNSEHVPSTVKTCLVSSYFLMLDTFASTGDQRKRTILDRDIVLHDEDADDDKHFTLRKAIENDNLWDEETGEIDGKVVDGWRDDPKKSCPWTFKYGDSQGRQYVEKCRFFGQMEDCYLNGQTINNVAVSALADLSLEDLNNINCLFEEFKSIREQPTASLLAGDPQTAPDFKRALYALTPAQIRSNAALASFIGLEALAARDDQVRKYMISFKLMVRKLDWIFGAFSHVTDGSLCHMFSRDITNDRAACTAWHLIVDEGTAPTFFTNGVRGPAGSNRDNVFQDFAEVEDFIAQNTGVTDFDDSEGQLSMVRDVLDALLRVSRQVLKDNEDKKRTGFDINDDPSFAAIKAPIAFVRIMQRAKVDGARFKAVARAVLGPDLANSHEMLAKLDAQGAVQLVARGIRELGAGLNAGIQDEWETSFTVQARANVGALSTFPSPYVVTASSLGSAGFWDRVRLADAGFVAPLSEAEHNAVNSPDAFYRLYHKARPSVYSKSYPAANINEAAYMGRETSNAYRGAVSAEEATMMRLWNGMPTVNVASEPRQAMYAAVPRAPIVRGGNNDTTSIRHAQWFLNDVHWTNSPAFVNNWNRILGTTDVPTRVAMAAFLFSRLTRDAYLRMCDKKNMAVPYQAMLIKIAHGHDMGGFIATKSGPELGITAWTNPLAMTEDNTTLMMSEKHYAFYMKCIIKNPKFIIRWDAAYFCGYKGGGGLRPYTMADIEAWMLNDYIPVRFARYAPSVVVIALAPSETEFRPYIDFTGQYPAVVGSPKTELHYSSAPFYVEKYHFGTMNPTKAGFLAYYPAPVAPRVAYAGRWYTMDATGNFDKNKATHNRGHLKQEYPGIGAVRAGYVIAEPRQEGVVTIG